MSAAADDRPLAVRLRDAMPRLPAAEQRIVTLLVEQPLDAAHWSIAELARRADTSSTSVVRCFQRLGYRHLKDLRVELATAATRAEVRHGDLLATTGDIDRRDTLAAIVAKVASNESLSIADTADALDLAALRRAVKLVAGARRVDCFGVGASSFVGGDLQQKLARIGRTALNWHDAHSAWTSAVTLDKRCVAVAVSHGGESADTVEFARLAGGAGAKTIAITNFAGSPLAAVADVVLTTAARETPFRSGAFGSRIAQLMVVDCLFTAVAQSSYDESLTALRATYAAVHRRTR